ncbi:hypothetical protein Fcan01_03136 [Folsomia candida]|uniref:Uncharacterized protein n=2 Tax=Folsomia candida TaxID=158441 RepID=A0A226F3J5_FOLCA|nr:hypothetical protein Fcan01_03136 [Folsomia candida]
MCRVDPSLPVRRGKSVAELMESYGNRKDIGLSILWTIAQAGVDSPYLLKIVSNYLLPYYGFKHYKQFVLAALSTLSSCSTMAVEYLIEGDEFEEFFEAAFDPKKKRDLEKIYPRVKELVFKGLKGQGCSIFLKFLEKASDKDFMPLSAYGTEVFKILLGCIENDPACIDTWRENLAKYPKESAAFLSYLSRVPETMKCGSRLETKLIQSDEFAVSAVKNPELLRCAKKVQAGLERVALSKRKLFSWKLAIFVIFILIGVLFWLDVTENGKGSFEKSNTGNFLDKYGVLHEAVVVWNSVTGMLKYIQEYMTVLFRSIYEGLQPMLQGLAAKIQEYIPQLSEYIKIIANFVTSAATKFVEFLQTNVFVGPLSPENLRKLTKDALSFIWTNIVYGMEKLYSIVEKYVS